MFRRHRWASRTASLALVGGGCALGPVAAQSTAPLAPTSNVGDIAFDPARDRADFTRCGPYGVLSGNGKYSTLTNISSLITSDLL